MERVRRRMFAGLAALALAGGLAVAAGTAGNAATIDCGAFCIALASQEYGTGYVSAVSGGTAQIGQKIILSAAGQYSAEDFRAVTEGTVAEFYTVGLISAVMDLTWPTLSALQYQYAPDGTYSGLCLAADTTAANGTTVDLQECGASALTVWVPLPSDDIGGYEPLISGHQLRMPRRSC